MAIRFQRPTQFDAIQVKLAALRVLIINTKVSTGTLPFLQTRSSSDSPVFSLHAFGPVVLPFNCITTLPPFTKTAGPKRNGFKETGIGLSEAKSLRRIRRHISVVLLEIDCISVPLGT